LAFKRGFTDPVPERQERAYADKGIDEFHARARFTGPNALDVGGEAVNARHVLLASGADMVVHAAGRAPDLAPLDLAAGEVELEDGRLKLNEYLQSVSNPAVYAAGDAAQKGPPLKPVSTRDARAVATNILQGNTSLPDYRAVPTVAFTSPPIAAVGLTKEEARQRGLHFRVQTENAISWFTAGQAAEPTYGFKTLVEAGTDLVLGAHIVGSHADEVINLFAMAMRHGLTVTDIKSTVFAYPTGASDVGYMV
jgi:glutathione reductase (NADPH)